jgi:hypothetical protein
MNDLTAKDIAIAIDDIGRCPCGNAAAAVFECESTNCGSNFCFSCMQKYIHGRIIIPYKLCEPHFHSEINCRGLDGELAEWESKVASTLSSISSARSLLESKTVKPALLLLGLAILGIGGAAINEPDAMNAIGIGALLLLSGFAIMPMTEARLKSNEATLEELISNIPNNNPHERPVLPEREINTITNNTVKEYLVLI